MSHSLKPIERVTAGEAVAQQIMALIVDGTWSPGDKLPPEQELMEKLQVGRTSVREAIRALALVGLLVTQQGRGTFVSETFSGFVHAVAGWSPLVGDRDLTKIMEVREPLEVIAAGLAAQRVTMEHIASMEQAVADFERNAGDAETQAEADLRFHAAISQAAGNPVLSRIIASLRGLMEESIVVATRVTAEQGTVDETIAGHREVLEAIRNQHPESARQAMQKHMACTWRVLQAGRLITEATWSGQKGRVDA